MFFCIIIATIEITMFNNPAKILCLPKNNLGMCFKTFIVILKPTKSRNEFIVPGSFILVIYF